MWDMELFEDIVFPTGVGMNPSDEGRECALLRVPHRRGDEPANGRLMFIIDGCSPQAWG